MTDAKTRVLLTLLLIAVLVAAMFIFQPYSADWPSRAYTQPARSYIRAALRQDSVALRRQSASLSPVLWALNAARAHRDTLVLWARRIQAWTGERRGDTTEVFVYPSGDRCGEAPIVLRFVGSGKRAKVARATSACFGPS